MSFGSGLLLNVVRLRFVRMKGVHFYVFFAFCLAFLLSTSIIVVRKIYFLFFGSGLLLNIVKLRFVQMKSLHF